MNEGGEEFRRCKILYDEEIIEQARHATSIVEDEDKGPAEPGGQREREAITPLPLIFNTIKSETYSIK